MMQTFLRLAGIDGCFLPAVGGAFGLEEVAALVSGGVRLVLEGAQLVLIHRQIKWPHCMLLLRHLLLIALMAAIFINLLPQLFYIRKNWMLWRRQLILLERVVFYLGVFQ